VPVELQAASIEDPRGKALLEALSSELRSIYGDDGTERFQDPCHFLLACSRGKTLGCAALVPFSSQTLEVKRMYVTPEARGQGVGRLLLAGLESWARQHGYHRLILETGDLRPEAAGLYRAAGFQPIEPYGPFVGNPHSLCFEKTFRPPD
jgi:GNAT superfamily N-acetyltransferase